MSFAPKPFTIMDLKEYITTALLTCLISIIIYMWKKNDKLPPGPWGFPFFGYYPFLTAKPYLDLGKLWTRYGAVSSFRTVGGSLIVVINGSKTLKEVFINRSEEFIARPFETHVLDWFSDGLGVTQEEGDIWKEQRRFFLRSVKQFGFGKVEMEPKMHEEIQILIEELRKTNGKEANILLDLAHTTNSVICHILFSKRFDKNERVFQDISRGLLDMLEMFVNSRILLVGWFFHHIIMRFSSGGKKANMAKKILRKILDDVVDERIRHYDPGNVRDYVDSYIHQRAELEKSGDLEKSTFSLLRLKAISMNMVMEGTYSVAETICTLLLELSHHVEEQKEAQAELDNVIGQERLPSWTDKPNIPYVDALVLELLRKAMHFNTSTLYSNFEETYLHGFRIPKRSVVIANLWSVNNDPKTYPNPEVFNPRRYLDSDGKRIKSDGPYPYGVGKRACIGESLAQMEVFLVIAAVVQHFTLYPGKKGSHTVQLVARHNP